MRRTPTIVAGEPDLHAWCPVCQLPTRVRVPLHLGHTGGQPTAVLEICPGCGTGHDRPSIAVTEPPRERRRPLVAAVHAAHQWACRRRGRPSLGCAHRDCPWPGLYRKQHAIPGEDGTWRLFFCSKRHRRAWAADNGIVLNDRGDAG